uniref:RRM domain-containing protein n=1 Tax=Parastrongyloides trichosuri TaxID=131310 RepID=A0A0N4ZZ76_PARTI
MSDEMDSKRSRSVSTSKSLSTSPSFSSSTSGAVETTPSHSSIISLKGQRNASRSPSSEAPIVKRLSKQQARSPTPNKKDGEQKNRDIKVSSQVYRVHNVVKPSNCIGVFGMRRDTTASVVEDYFYKYGKIEDIRIIRDYYSRESKGFCFITFRKLSNAEDALRGMNGKTIEGKVVRVDYAIPKGIPRYKYKWDKDEESRHHHDRNSSYRRERYFEERRRRYISRDRSRSIEKYHTSYRRSRYHYRSRSPSRSFSPN